MIRKKGGREYVHRGRIYRSPPAADRAGGGRRPGGKFKTPLMPTIALQRNRGIKAGDRGGDHTSIMYQDYIHISPGPGASEDLRRFGAEKTRIQVGYDSELVSRIEEFAGREGLAAGTLGEREKKLDHGVRVPLYFIDQYLDDYKVVRISISGLTPLEHYRFGKCIQKAVKETDRRTVIVASGDLSHRLKDEGPYDYAEEGPIFDEQVTQAMAVGDF